MPKYPITVQLTGEDDNALVIISRVRAALKKRGATQSELEEFTNEATSGDYNHVLQTCLEWVEVE